MTVGEHREFVLPGLGTAGYRWESELAGEAVAVSRHLGTAGEGPHGRRVGASVPEVLELIALVPGRATIRLAQRRPWETGAPHAEHVLVIEVRPP